MTDPRERFGPVLRDLRQQSGLSQSALARRAGTNHSMVSRLEHRNRYPSRPMVVRLAAALELDPAGRASLLEAAGFSDGAADIDVASIQVTPVVNDPLLARFLQLLNDERVSEDLVWPVLDRIDEFIERAEYLIGRPA